MYLPISLFLYLARQQASHGIGPLDISQLRSDSEYPLSTTRASSIGPFVLTAHHTGCHRRSTAEGGRGGGEPPRGSAYGDGAPRNEDGRKMRDPTGPRGTELHPKYSQHESKWQSGQKNNLGLRSVTNTMSNNCQYVACGHSWICW